MHPVIRVICFLVLATSLSVGGGWRHTLFAAVLVIVAYSVSRRRGLAQLSKMLRRLRWLWLSLCVVYFWFTPGPALLSALGRWSPTVPGVQEGLVRAAILAVLVAGANLLLQTTVREQLVGAIHWLCAPLQLFGLSRDRFALRLVLVLETVPEIQPLRRVDESAGATDANRIRRLGSAAAALFADTLARAAQAPTRQIAIPATGAPPLYQWSWPLLIGLGFWLIGVI